jgi:Kef-type K+ transport system membrane component KefB/Trk K+ transport system NAD-binding subunit
MSLFIELSLIIIFTALISALMRILKQPIVIGYILTGIILGPQVLNIYKSPDILSVFSEMGIAILLFIVGLHLSPNEAKSLGKPALIMGLLQVGLTSFLGFLTAFVLGFSTVASMYIGVGVSFSSTIIVLKLLADKKDLEKLYGRISIGILLFQDIVAAFCFIFTSTVVNGHISYVHLFYVLGKFLLLTIFIILVSVLILPKLSNFFAKSQEYLFIFSLAWGLGLASLFSYVGLSIEIGALIAGVALSVTTYSPEISSRLRPLRDFFVVMFFISLGAGVTLKNFNNIVFPLFALLIFVIVIKPFIMFLLMMLFRYNKKTGFFGGISLGQISEFSMILGVVGLRLGHISESVVSMLTLLGVLSIAISSYLVMYMDKLYPFFSPFIGIFQRKGSLKERSIVSYYDVVLFGCNRVGYDFIKTYKKLGPSFLAVDFDPDVIRELEKSGVNCEYGDAEDTEYLEDINIQSTKLVVSTIPDFESNLFLLSKIRETNKNSVVILLSYNIDDAIKLYEEGATYVILPHFISGEIAASFAEEAGFDISKLDGKRKEHIKYLKERKRLGHTHPLWIHHQVASR